MTVLEAVPVTPILSHTGYGVWTITNYDTGATYTATATAGSVTVSGNTVTADTANTTVTVTSTIAGTPRTATAERKAYTYSDTFVGGSGYYHAPPAHGSGSDYFCAIYDGQTDAYHTTGYTVSTKDPTPAGYTDHAGEWHRNIY